MTFTIKARYFEGITREKLVEVDIRQHGFRCLTGTMTPVEWDAFQSLLMPCVRADFRLEVVDEK